MTSLGVRLGGPKTLSFLINADHHITDSSSSSSSRLVACRGGGLIHRNQFNPKQQKKVIYNNFRTASATAVTTPTSCSSSPPVQVDPILGTDICSSCPTNRRRANRVGVDQQESPPPPPTISAEKLDDWIKNSISEIVRNIGDSPLLVHLYSSKNKGYSSSSITSRIEKAEPGSWTNIARRWEEGSSVPDGIILVEQLNQEEEEVLGNSNNTKTWGLVIQGRGVDSASSCYILKTCRVLSSLGFCTHFCLVRAKCFGEIPNLQLKNSWLLNH